MDDDDDDKELSFLLVQTTVKLQLLIFSVTLKHLSHCLLVQTYFTVECILNFVVARATLSKSAHS